MASSGLLDIDNVEAYSVKSGGSRAAEDLADFDRLIQFSWQQKMDEGAFRYPFRHPQCKKLLGNYNYLAQFNSFRVTSRRKPEAMMSVKQPFDPEKFNFNKVEDKEVVFQAGGGAGRCIINVSPIEFGHCLFVPYGELPQVLTLQAIQSALKLMLLSRQNNFKIAFNSLCAYASVNHLHWHLYYLHPDYDVPVAACQAKEVQNGLYELVDYPAKGFALQLTSVDKWSAVADAVFKLVQYLADNQVAHNVFITRGASLDGQRYGTDNEVIRVLIWARQPIVGHKDPGDFCIAVCELAGQMLIYNQEAYANLTQETVVKAHQQTCEATFQTVKEPIMKLFSD